MSVDQTEVSGSGMQLDNWGGNKLVLAPGRHQFRLCTMAATMGANVRVGLEDNLYLAKGELARSNADQVRRMRQILELLSFEIATPDEARRMLKLREPSATEH